MAVYAIGDIQGCYNEFRRLLDKIKFDPSADKLWLAGDLVNRGPDSLKVLRFVKQLGAAAITVLGNHDLHFLALANGTRKSKRRDTLDDVLNASDCNDLVEWLRFLPLLHNDNTLGYTLIHAGLPPQWDLEKATNCAIEVEAVLQSDDYKYFLTHMYGNLPNCWDDSLHEWDRLRFITNCFTRLRFVDQQGNLALDEKGPPGTQSENCLPWFECAHPRINSAKIIFGHWSTLGTIKSNHFFPIDSGCVWGHKLTALCINENPSKHKGTEQDASKNITKKPDTYTEIITIDCAGACDPRDYM